MTGVGAGLPFGLTGKTLGVLGLGTLGSGVAKVGLALDMEVIALEPELNKRSLRRGRGDAGLKRGIDATIRCVVGSYHP